jgi:outer membrane protein TolC
MKRILFGWVVLTCFYPAAVLHAGDLGLTDFLKAAAGNDPRFLGYLAENLSLVWQDRLALPADDFVIKASAEYALLLEDPAADGFTGSVAVSKLFPSSGTTAGVSYRAAPVTSALSLTLEQDIARNAFGRSTRWQGELSSLSTEISRFQIAEAYEDYFADCVRLWYDWRSAWLSMTSAEWGWRESLKLLENVEVRAARSVATATEVAQARLRVLDKRDAMLNARTLYERKTRLIRYRAGVSDSEPIQPPEKAVLPFKGWTGLPESSEGLLTLTRSGKILKLLSGKADLTVKIRQEDLLPSVTLYAAYRMTGNGYEMAEPANSVTLGIGFEYPLPGTQARARYEQSLQARDRNQLTVADTLGRLWIDLADLKIRLDNADELIVSGRERVALSEQIYRDKQKEYERGSADLDDLFTAQNSVQTARLQLTTREAERDLLLVEWYRLTDQLVQELNQP